MVFVVIVMMVAVVVMIVVVMMVAVVVMIVVVMMAVVVMIVVVMGAVGKCVVDNKRTGCKKHCYSYESQTTNHCCFCF